MHFSGRKCMQIFSCWVDAFIIHTRPNATERRNFMKPVKYECVKCLCFHICEHLSTTLLPTFLCWCREFLTSLIIISIVAFSALFQNYANFFSFFRSLSRIMIATELLLAVALHNSLSCMHWSHWLNGHLFSISSWLIVAYALHGLCFPSIWLSLNEENVGVF